MMVAAMRPRRGISRRRDQAFRDFHEPVLHQHPDRHAGAEALAVEDSSHSIRKIQLIKDRGANRCVHEFDVTSNNTLMNHQTSNKNLMFHQIDRDWPHMSKDEIRQWLENRGQTREWLANEVGVSKGTVDQWFSKGFPLWVIKAIQRLDGLPADPAAGLEVQFTAAEFELVEKARQLSGHPTRPAFYRDAIISLAERILKDEAAPEKSVAPTVNSGALPKTAKIVPLLSPSELNRSADIAAESATGTSGPKMRQPTNYVSSKRPRKS